MCEYKTGVTGRILRIQLCIGEIRERCLRAIFKSHPSLPEEDLTRTDLMTHELPGLIRHHLRLEWHRVSLKTRHLISELSLLHAMEERVGWMDGPSFFRFLETAVIGSRIAFLRNPFSSSSTQQEYPIEAPHN